MRGLFALGRSLVLLALAVGVLVAPSSAAQMGFESWYDALHGWRLGRGAIEGTDDGGRTQGKLFLTNSLKDQFVDVRKNSTTLFHPPSFARPDSRKRRAAVGASI